VKLNIGCGTTKKEGYKGVDINPSVGADFCCQAWELPLAANSVDEIYARHFIEHVSLQMAKKTLLEWKRVLKDSGMIYLIFPNLEFHCKQLLLPGQSEFVTTSNFEHAMAGLYGWTAAYTSAPFMEHKWGYTKSSFSLLAEDVGLLPIFEDCRKCDIEVMLRHVEDIAVKY